VNVIAGNPGPYTTSPGFLVTAAGTYQWTAHFSGDANNAAADSGCTAEPVILTNPFQGCTPGFWKNHLTAWDSTSDKTVSTLITSLVPPYGYDPTLTNFNNQLFFQVIGLPTGPDQGLGLTLTLVQALNLGGGDFQALARHGAAALLSSASVKYTYTTSQVLAGLNAAFKSGNSNLVIPNVFPDGVLNDLEAANNQNDQACPTS
jgi:hypothetical protein